jgi:hypothetical protein
VLHDIRIDRSVAAEGAAVKGDSRKRRIGIVFNGDIATKRGGRVLRGRRRSGERDVYVTGSHGTAKHRVRYRRVRKERGRRGSTAVSRGKVRLTSGTGAGDRILPEGRIGEAISSGFGMQRLPLRRRRLEKEEGHFATVNRADGASIHSNERIRCRYRRPDDPGSNLRRYTEGVEAI